MGRKKNEHHLELEYNYDRLGVQKLEMAYQLLVPSLPPSCNEKLPSESIRGDKEDGNNDRVYQCYKERKWNLD